MQKVKIDAPIFTWKISLNEKKTMGVNCNFY